uniref:Uncharacterized protein n=1 Tax=Fabrea salina TaxID=342563 RepID=A0A7S3MRG5_9CILI|mmetsp:Transcript_396/g.689  ORF Transcript_396/g.689 Transcript_396/m.689 type:complete len:392 (+) Transcript_396:6-1181(+)
MEDSFLSGDRELEDSLLVSEFDPNALSFITDNSFKQFKESKVSRIEHLLFEIEDYLSKLGTEHDYYIKELKTQKSILNLKKRANEVTEDYLQEAEQKHSKLVEEIQSLNKQGTSRFNFSFDKDTIQSEGCSEEELSKLVFEVVRMCIYQKPSQEIQNLVYAKLSESPLSNCLVSLEKFIKDQVNHILSIETSELNQQIQSLKKEHYALKQESKNSVKSALALQELHYTMKLRKTQELCPIKSQIEETNQQYKNQIKELETQFQNLHNTIKELTQEKQSILNEQQQLINQIETNWKNYVKDLKNKFKKQYQEILTKTNTQIKHFQEILKNKFPKDQLEKVSLMSTVRIEITKLAQQIEETQNSADAESFLKEVVNKLHYIALHLLNPSHKPS